MRTLISNDVCLTAFPSIKCELLAKDANWNDGPFFQLLGDINRLPKSAKIAASDCVRTCPHEVNLFDNAIKIVFGVE